MCNIKVSFVIPVYNGEKDIGRCLQSLSEQTASQDLFEIIVVNNNSKDNTVKIAESFKDKIRNYKIVDEYNIGLSNARNRGYKEASAEYVGYLDDDSKPRVNYIEKAIEIIEKVKPDIFGGPISPFYITEKPYWFKDQYEIRKESDTSGFLTKGTLYGSNMIFKKEFLIKHNGFNAKVGMTGDNLGYSEETLLIINAFKEKKRIYYDVELIVEHKVEDYKMHIIYSMLEYFFHGYSTYNKKERFIIEDYLSVVKKTFKDINLYLKQYSKNNLENYLIENEEFKYIFDKLGTLLALIENRHGKVFIYKTYLNKLINKFKKSKIYSFLKKIFFFKKIF